MLKKKGNFYVELQPALNSSDSHCTLPILLGALPREFSLVNSQTGESRDRGLCSQTAIKWIVKIF